MDMPIIRTTTIWTDGDVTNEYTHSSNEEVLEHVRTVQAELAEWRNKKDPRVVRCWNTEHKTFKEAEAAGDADREKFSTDDWFWSKKTA